MLVVFDLSPRTERCTWHRRGDDGPQCMASRSPYVHPYHSTMEPAGPETELPPQDPTATTTNRVPREQIMSCRKFHSTSQQLNDDPTGPWPAGWNDKDVAPNQPRASKGCWHRGFAVRLRPIVSGLVWFVPSLAGQTADPSPRRSAA